MTIAACYLSADGVVFGADSTTTMYVAGVGPGAEGCEHHYDFAQKVFQIGENSTLGLTMWGLGNLRNVSYRTLIAQFADSLIGKGAQSMSEVADRWSQFFWAAYSTDLGWVLQRTQLLQSQATKTPQEEGELEFLLRAFSGGFCIGGYLMNDRGPRRVPDSLHPNNDVPWPGRSLGRWEHSILGLSQSHASAASWPRPRCPSRYLAIGQIGLGRKMSFLSC